MPIVRPISLRVIPLNLCMQILYPSPPPHLFFLEITYTFNPLIDLTLITFIRNIIHYGTPSPEGKPSSVGGPGTPGPAGPLQVGVSPGIPQRSSRSSTCTSKVEDGCSHCHRRKWIATHHPRLTSPLRQWRTRPRGRRHSSRRRRRCRRRTVACRPALAAAAHDGFTLVKHEQIDLNNSFGPLHSDFRSA